MDEKQEKSIEKSKRIVAGLTAILLAGLGTVCVIDAVNSSDKIGKVIVSGIVPSVLGTAFFGYLALKGRRREN